MTQNVKICYPNKPGVIHPLCIQRLVNAGVSPVGHVFRDEPTFQLGSQDLSYVFFFDQKKGEIGFLDITFPKPNSLEMRYHLHADLYDTQNLSEGRPKYWMTDSVLVQDSDLPEPVLNLVKAARRFKSNRLESLSQQTPVFSQFLLECTKNT